MSNQQPTPPPQPLHKYYVNVADGEVYPCLKSPPGYEDQNPADWRPANAMEIAAYLRKVQQITAAQQFNADGGTKLGGKGANTITLEPETPEIPVVDLGTTRGSDAMPAPATLELASEPAADVAPAAAPGALSMAIPPPPTTTPEG